MLPLPQISYYPHPPDSCSCQQAARPAETPLISVPLPASTPRSHKGTDAEDPRQAQIPSPFPRPAAPAPLPHAAISPLGWGRFAEKSPLGEGTPEPPPFHSPLLPSAPSISILASDLWNNPLVSCAARYWFNFNPQQWSLSPPLLVSFTPSCGHIQTPISRPISTSLSPLLPEAPRLCTSRSPEQGQPCRFPPPALLARSCRPRSSGSVSSCRGLGPATPAPHPFPRRAEAPLPSQNS